MERWVPMVEGLSVPNALRNMGKVWGILCKGFVADRKVGKPSESRSKSNRVNPRDWQITLDRASAIGALHQLSEA